jgi:NADH-quinone oxidoreductase subunit J
MSPEQISFLFFAGLTLSGAIAVVTMRNLVHAALCMALCFFSIAGIFILLEAPFFSVLSVLIGVGAISILIIFAIMLTRRAGTETAGTSQRWPLALAIAVALFGGLTLVFSGIPMTATKAPLKEDPLPVLGLALVDPNQYILPFEIASVLLLAALIGSIFITWRNK